MAKNNFYVLKKGDNNIVAFTDNYKALLTFIHMHQYTVRGYIVERIKFNEFASLKMTDNEKELCVVDQCDGLVIRQKDSATFNKLLNESQYDLSYAVVCLNKILKWNIKSKEVDNICKTINILNKYLDKSNKIAKKSGIKDMCSDMNILDEIFQLDNNKQ